MDQPGRPQPGAGRPRGPFPGEPRGKAHRLLHELGRIGEAVGAAAEPRELLDGTLPHVLALVGARTGFGAHLVGDRLVIDRAVRSGESLVLDLELSLNDPPYVQLRDDPGDVVEVTTHPGVASRLGSPRTILVPLRDADGSIRGLFELHGATHLNGDGPAAGLGVAARIVAAGLHHFDVLDELRGANRSVREAEESLRLVLETANEAFIGMDENGAIVDWNRRAEEIFGWTATEVVGRAVAEVVIPDRFRAEHWDGLDHFKRTGEGPILFKRLELPALHREGHEFDSEITIWPSRSQGRYRFNAFIRDITARKRLQATIALRQRITKAANEAAELSTAVRTALQEVCGLTRWPLGHAYLVSEDDPDVLLPTDWWFASHDSFRNLQEVTARTTFRRGRGLPGRVLEAGEPVWMPDLDLADFPRRESVLDLGVASAFAFPVRSGERVVAVAEFFSEDVSHPDPELLAVMGDIGTQLGRVWERQRAEDELRRVNDELLQTDKLKSQFVSIVSHELQTPLVTIRGFGALVEDEWGELDDDEKLAHVRAINRHARRISRMVGDLLTLSRIQAGVIKSSPADVAVCGAVEQVVADLEIDEVEVSCPQDVRIRVDLDHFIQILINFLSNAQKYGAPPYEVTVGALDERVEIAVIDHGEGVPEEFVPSLFEPFTQAVRGSGQSGGAGLGLSIVAGLVRANRGTLRYEVTADGGARFVVAFPRTG